MMVLTENIQREISYLSVSRVPQSMMERDRRVDSHTCKSLSSPISRLPLITKNKEAVTSGCYNFHIFHKIWGSRGMFNRVGAIGRSPTFPLPATQILLSTCEHSLCWTLLWSLKKIPIDNISRYLMELW